MTAPTGTAAALREAFDRSFADSGQAATTQSIDESFLGIRVAEDPFALRLSEIAGLYLDRQIMPLPSPVRELLGISGFRGALAPVYHLGLLLGYPAGPPCRWLAVVRGDCLVALAFDLFETHLRIPADQVAPADGAGTAGLVQGLIAAPRPVRPIVDVSSVMQAIARRVADSTSARSDDR
jgi:chemotaxis signal transduction protein